MEDETPGIPVIVQEREEVATAPIEGTISLPAKTEINAALPDSVPAETHAAVTTAATSLIDRIEQFFESIPAEILAEYEHLKSLL